VLGLERFREYSICSANGSGRSPQSIAMIVGRHYRPAQYRPACHDATSKGHIQNTKWGGGEDARTNGMRGLDQPPRRPETSTFKRRGKRGLEKGEEAYWLKLWRRVITWVSSLHLGRSQGRSRGRSHYITLSPYPSVPTVFDLTLNLHHLTQRTFYLYTLSLSIKGIRLYSDVTLRYKVEQDYTSDTLIHATFGFPGLSPSKSVRSIVILLTINLGVGLPHPA